MDHDGVKYEQIMQQEEPEATMGAWNDSLARGAGEEDHLADTWPVSEGRESTALALTQLGLDNGIEMMVSELRKVANIGEDMLKHSNPGNPASDKAIYNHKPDTSVHDREHPSNRIPRPNQQCVKGQSLNIDEQQATSGAHDSHPSTACSKDSPSPLGVSPCLSLSRGTQGFGHAQSDQEKGIRMPESTHPDKTTRDDKVSKVTAELAKLFENTSKALKALTGLTVQNEAPIKTYSDPPFPLRPGYPAWRSNCQLPCVKHNLVWLEERVTVLDSTLGDVDLADWTNLLPMVEEFDPAIFQADEHRWFKKRILLLCCWHGDIHDIERKDTIDDLTGAKAIHTRIRTNLKSNTAYIESVLSCLLGIQDKHRSLPIFRLAVTCIIAIGCAYNTNIDITIGQILDHFFHEKLLPRPEKLDKATWKTISAIAICIVEAVSYRHLDRRFTIQVIENGWDKIDNRLFLSKTISSVFTDYHWHRSRISAAKSSDPVLEDIEQGVKRYGLANFDVRDLDIKSLQRIGRLCILWVEDFERHLLLLRGNENILFVCWFAHFPGLQSMNDWDRRFTSPVNACFMSVLSAGWKWIC